MTAPAWHQGYQIAFDLESTGVNVHEDRIITAAIVHAKPDQRPRTLTWVINPGVPIPTGASDIHGWTNERIATYRDPRGRRPLDPAQACFEVAGQVALAMSQGVPLIGFNLAYDLSLLEAECRRHGIPSLTERLPKGLRGCVDAMVIDKHYSRRKGSRKLTDQCSHYRVPHTGAHDAGADALATIRLVARQVAAYPELRRMSLSKLFQSQIGWRAEQMDSLRAYFDRSGIAHDGCAPDWPLHRTAVPA